MSRIAAFAHKIRIDVHAAWLCARDPNVALPVRIFGLAIAAYALSPIDLIPDFIPVIGLLDDLVIIPVCLWLFLKLLPDGIFAHHRAIAEQYSDRPVSKWGAVFIVAVWLLAIVSATLVLSTP
jgi:uncharacterized membrane protein YkvA (DUF1232 family)